MDSDSSREVRYLDLILLARAFFLNASVLQQWALNTGAQRSHLLVPLQSLAPCLSKYYFKRRTLWEGCLSNRTFESSFLSVEVFHAYMKSSMPLPQRHRVKGIIQGASKTLLKSSRSYSRCKTTITPINPNRTFFIHGCSESMMVT